MVLDSHSVWEKIDVLYEQGKPYIAEFASLVFDAYKAGNAGAIEIIDRNARAMGELLQTAKSRYNTAGIAIASGGLFQHYSDIMKKQISKHTDIELIISDMPPIYGACKNACNLASAKMSDDFCENFKKTIGRSDSEYS